MQLSDRVLGLEESATLEMAKKARALAAQGVNVINLSLGEPDFDTPSHIRDAAKDALDQGYTRYTPVNGLVELRQAIVDKFKRDNDLIYSENQIVVSNGAKQSIANVFYALINPGDEVIVLTPYWVSYASMIQMAGGRPVFVKASVEENYKPSATMIESAITAKTKAIIYSSPSNPTGAVFSEKELLEISEMLLKYPNITVISDEIYEFINYHGHHHSMAQMPGMKDRTVVVNGFSKGFAMTGWRLGYIAANDTIAAACTKIQGQYTSGATSFGQFAAAHALNSSYAPSIDMQRQYRKRKDLVLSRIRELGDWKCSDPEGAFYVFPDVSKSFGKSFRGQTIHTANDLCMLILAEAHVALVDGEAFGAPECLRISFAASEEQLMKAFDAIIEVLTPS